MRDLKKEGNFMNIQMNPDRLLERLEHLLYTPSVVGYYPEIHQLLENIADSMGLKVFYDRQRTAYIFLEGQDRTKTVMVGAHLDEVGLIVRQIGEDGLLHIQSLGGNNFHSLEGENCIIHTRDSGNLTGSVICSSHSVHVFDDARTLEREHMNMRVLIDANVHSRQDVLNLGVQVGDLISIDPKLVITDNGYIKARHLDDKACVSVLLEVACMLWENERKPAYNTLLAFPIYEEIGHGGTYVPVEVSEYLAMDIGLIGPEQTGDEKAVSICAADKHSPYDWGFTTGLINLAEEQKIDYRLDTHYRYGSDATAAIMAGCNLYPGLIGPAVWNSHGYERTHLDGLMNTLALTLAYLIEGV